ncbi:MAG: hypothetical protein ACLU7P_06670 [Eggerthella lenta]
MMIGKTTRVLRGYKIATATMVEVLAAVFIALGADARHHMTVSATASARSQRVLSLVRRRLLCSIRLFPFKKSS